MGTVTIRGTQRGDTGEKKKTRVFITDGDQKKQGRRVDKTKNSVRMKDKGF